MKKDQKLSGTQAAVRIFTAVFLVAACAGALALILQGSAHRADMPTSSAAVSPAATAVVSSAAPSSSKVLSAPSSKPVPKPVSITILGAGDDLIHDVIYQQASRRAGGKGYDFSPVYARIAGDIKSADISVVNQETILAGNVAPLSGYPRFNSPTQLGDELVNLGFDVINQANNHVLDQNEKGLAAALAYWDTKPVKAIGAYRSDADLEDIRIVEAKGIKTAHIGITEMTNGLSLPKNSKYRLIYADNTPLIEHLIKKAKSMADVVVVSIHWGTENTETLTDRQKTLAQNMVDWGADIIFGNHPHVVQQLAVLTRKDGTKCPVMYAFGNLVSAQQSGKNMVSGLLTVTVTKDFATDKTTFTGMKFKPIVTQYGPHCSNITIYPLDQYTDALAAAHGVRAFTPDFSLKFIRAIINRNIPEQYQAKD
jgi:Putative enzyme of poly-gamma-glutamate biosynthesis (capsule formation)